jgi:hypothetical protein
MVYLKKFCRKMYMYETVCVYVYIHIYIHTNYLIKMIRELENRITFLFTVIISCWQNYEENFNDIEIKKVKFTIRWKLKEIQYSIIAEFV